jgi:hypothetical protein
MVRLGMIAPSTSKEMMEALRDAISLEKTGLSSLLEFGPL